MKTLIKWSYSMKALVKMVSYEDTFEMQRYLESVVSRTPLIYSKYFGCQTSIILIWDFRATVVFMKVHVTVFIILPVPLSLCPITFLLLASFTWLTKKYMHSVLIIKSYKHIVWIIK